jgi:hypothetical protein
LLRLALWPKYALLRWKFYGLLKRLYILLLLYGIFFRNLSGPFDLWYHSILEFLYWSFCLNSLLVVHRGVLKSATTTFLGPICIFMFNSVCLKKLGTLTLGAYILKIFIAFWYIAPFICVKWPSLSLLTNTALEFTLSGILLSILSGINIATCECFGGPKDWETFHPKSGLFLSVMWIYCKQHIVGTSIFI